MRFEDYMDSVRKEAAKLAVPVNPTVGDEIAAMKAHLDDALRLLQQIEPSSNARVSLTIKAARSSIEKSCRHAARAQRMDSDVY